MALTIAKIEAIATGSYHDPDLVGWSSGTTTEAIALNEMEREQTEPNSYLTPGDSIPGITKADVCSVGWAKRQRQVPDDIRKRIFAEYNRKPGPVLLPKGADDTCCELDHLIPLELGGSNDPRNLWPQFWSDARVKDGLENRLHQLVCEYDLPLKAAQRCIARDWFDCDYATTMAENLGK